LIVIIGEVSGGGGRHRVVRRDRRESGGTASSFEWGGGGGDRQRYTVTVTLRLPVTLRCDYVTHVYVTLIYTLHALRFTVTRLRLRYAVYYTFYACVTFTFYIRTISPVGLFTFILRFTLLRCYGSDLPLVTPRSCTAAFAPVLCVALFGSAQRFWLRLFYRTHHIRARRAYTATRHAGCHLAFRTALRTPLPACIRRCTHCGCAHRTHARHAHAHTACTPPLHSRQ